MVAFPFDEGSNMTGGFTGAVTAIHQTAMRPRARVALVTVDGVVHNFTGRLEDLR